MCLFYSTIFLAATSLILLLTSRTFRCFCSTSSWWGGMPCSSQAPSTRPLVWLGPLFPLVVCLLSGVLACAIISFIVSVMLGISAFILCLWFSLSALISSSVASACSSIVFALNCFAVSLFCYFSFAYSVEIKLLILIHVFFNCRSCFPFADSGVKFSCCLEVNRAMSLRSF